MSKFEEILDKDGILVYKTRGVSMEPMLRQERDLVVIRVPSSRLKKNDVALYKRGESVVLHRVIAVRDGYYLMRGDHTYALERVPDRNVIGVLVEFNRKGKLYQATDKRYMGYVRCWNAIYPLRATAARSVSIVKAVSRKTGLTDFVKKHTDGSRNGIGRSGQK